MTNCFFDNAFFNSNGFTNEDAIKLTLFTGTDQFKNWYGTKEPELDNGDFVNDKNVKLSSSRILDNFNTVTDPTKLVADSKLETDKVAEDIAQILGILPFSDETAKAFPIPVDKVYMPQIETLLSKHSRVIKESSNGNIHGDDYINTFHLNKDDDLIMFMPALIGEDDMGLINAAYDIIKQNDGPTDPISVVDKKILVLNQFYNIAGLKNPILKNILYNIAKNVSAKLGRPDIVISPTESMYSIITNVNDLETLDGINYQINKEEIIAEVDNSFTGYVTQKLRKFVFSILLDNLKSKFGIDYKWVKGEGFYGRLVDGVVEINENNFTDETPFHEYLHVILLSLQKDNPALYDTLINSPEVDQLAQQLARTQEYKDYPNEEALVRILSQEYSSLKASTIFKNFIQWLKNIFNKLFNIKPINIDILGLDMNIRTLNALLTDNNKYILNTNYIKNIDRYNYDSFNEFVQLNKEKKGLTVEQEKALLILEDHSKKIVNPVTVDEDEPDFYKFKDVDGVDVKLLRSTAVVKKDIDFDTDIHALGGTFIHNSFEIYLKLRHRGMAKPTETNLDDLIDQVFFVEEPGKTPHFAYKEGSKTHNSKPSTAYFQIHNSNLFENNVDSTKPFRDAILELMNTADEGTKKMLVSFNDKDMQNLLLTMGELEDNIINKIQLTEPELGVLDLNSLLIFSEMFVHNYEPTRTIQQYAGTLDIFVVSPTGKKYIFDIKTIGKSTFESNYGKTKDATLFRKSEKDYSIQQSLYKELIANIFGEEIVNNIESDIVFIQRSINFNWSPDVATIAHNNILDAIQNISVLTQNDIDEKTEIVNIINDFFAVNGADKLRRVKLINFLKNISFNSTELFQLSKVTDENTKKVLSYFNKHRILSKNLIPSSNVNLLSVNNPSKKDPRRIKRIPLLYDKKKLNDANIDILSKKSSHNFVVELNEILAMVDKQSFILQDNIQRLEELIKNNKYDNELEADLEYSVSKLAALKKLKTLIIIQLDKFNTFYDDGLTPEELDNKIKGLQKIIFSGEWKAFRRMITEITTNDNYKKYLTELKKARTEINDFLKKQNNIIEADKTKLKSYIITRKQITDEISKIRVSGVPISFNLINNVNNIEKIAAFINGAENKELTLLYERLVEIDFLIKNLQGKIENAEKHFIHISSYKQHLDETYAKVSKTKSLDTIIADAEFHKKNINNILDTIIDNAEIPLDTRAYYYEYVTKTIRLYSEIQKVLYGDEGSSLDDEIFDARKFNAKITELDLRFKQLDKKAAKSYKILVADLINSYKTQNVDAGLEIRKQEVDIFMYNEWLNIINTKTSKTDIVNAEIERYLNTLNSNKDIDALKRELKNNIEIKRGSVLRDLEKQLNNPVENSAINWINENIMTSTRSVYTVLQLYANLENYINQEYANDYDLLMNEIQIESVKFIQAYNAKISNQLKIGSLTLASEKYEAYKDLLALAEDPNFKTDNEALEYLTTYDKDLKTYNYQQVFDDEDLKLINTDNVNEIRRIISSNNLINKYRHIQTLRLVDRAKYGYNAIFQETYRAITKLQEDDKNQDVNRRTKNNNSKLITIRKLFELKNENSVIYDSIKFNFIDYLQYILDTYNDMIAINGVNDNKPPLYDITTLFGNDHIPFMEQLKNSLSIVSNGTHVGNIDMNLINGLNTGYFGEMIKDTLVGIDTTENLFSIDLNLRDNEANRLKTYFQSDKYTAIFMEEGMLAYEDFKQQFKRSVNIDDTVITARYNEEIDKLASKNLSALEYDLEKIKIDAKYDYLKINSRLKVRLNISPFTYSTLMETSKKATTFRINNNSVLETDSGVLNTYDKTVKIFENLTKQFENEEIKLLYYEKDKKEKIIFLIKNPLAYKYINETGNNIYFDPKWDIIQSNEAAYNYYYYIRNTLAKLYGFVPQSERHGASKLDLPYLEDSGIMDLIEQGKQKGKSVIDTMKSVTQYLKQKYTERTTSAIQNNDTKLGMSVSPILHETHLELRQKLKDANFQISAVIQMLAYNAVLYKTRSETEPLHNVITSIASNATNKQVSTGAKFYHHTNMMGVIPKEINEEAESQLTASDKINIKRWELQISKFTADKKILDETISKTYKYLYTLKRGDDLEDVDIDQELLDEFAILNPGLTKQEIISKYEYELVKLNSKRSIVESNIRSLENKKENLLRSRKPDNIDKTRALINSVRLVQLSYSLTGQIGNFINGMIQTAMVSTGTDAELNAFKRAIGMVDELMFKNKVMLGAAYGGNMVTSAIFGSGTGILSIPIWMMLAKSALDQMKDLNYIKSKFNPSLMKAFNMERFYNITFDVVEQARAGITEDTIYKYDTNTNTVIKNDDDLVKMLQPFDFVKRAEKMIAILNMLIQSFVTEIEIKGKKISFWDLHGDDGKIKPEYSPYITKDLTQEWTKKLTDRLIRANGNYTSKSQLESHWYGQLLLVYAKWIPETFRTYWGGYVPSDKNIYSNTAHEGIMISTYKKGVETYYNLMKNLMITDLNEAGLEHGKIIKDSAKGTIYDRIIIYKDGKIIRNHLDKENFINAYNKLVEFDNNYGNSLNIEDDKIKFEIDQFAEKFSEEFEFDIDYSKEDYLDININNLIKHYNIKFLKDITNDEKKSIFSRIKDSVLSFLVPFDFKESFKSRTLTRNVSDRLHKLMPDLNGEYTEYERVQYANLRRFYNYTHLMYSMFLSKALLLILMGYLTNVLEFDDDDEGIKSMKFVINRYNQLWQDVSYYSNPVSAFYQYFHNSMTSVKFAIDMMKLNVDIASTLPHGINMLLGDSEMGDVILESMGMRDPIIDRSTGITTVKPVNDFIDMIPLFNKMAGMKKQLENDYTDFER
jgi:hypothetical protein